MNKFQDMKLGDILATAGCRMVPHGPSINVVTSGGVVVLNGSIDEIRERVAFNCHHYGEPIIHPSIGVDGEPSFKLRPVVKMQCDDSDDENMPLRPRRPLVNKTKGKDGLGNKVDSRALPENRVGALQERYRTAGVTPEYEFKENPNLVRSSNKGESAKHSFSCKVKVGRAVCRGKGPTKKLAKQDAAGNMLIEVMNGMDPLAAKGHSSVRPKKTGGASRAEPTRKKSDGVPRAEPAKKKTDGFSRAGSAKKDGGDTRVQAPKKGVATRNKVSSKSTKGKRTGKYVTKEQINDWEDMVVEKFTKLSTGDRKARKTPHEESKELSPAR